MPHKWLCFGCIALGTFVGYADASIVNIALPTLSRHFRVDLSAVEWIVTSYLLMITGLVIIFGRLADMYGRKRLYVFGFVVFTAASALCGAAPDVWSLVAFRCLQGIGAAALFTNGTAIVTETFPPSERGRALGLIGSVLAFAAVVGPPVGGFLTEHVGWRSIFYVNIPIGVVGTLLAVKVLPANTARAAREQFDHAGAVTLFALLSCFLFLTSTLSGPDRQAPAFIALSVATASLAVLFIVIENRVEHPLIDLGIFRQWAFSAASLSSFLSFWAVAAISFLMPFYLDRVLLLSPTKSGALLAPVPVLLVVVAPLGGHLADKFGVRVVCTVGALINCLGLVWLSTLGTETSALGVVMRLLPFGVGMGLFQPPNNSAMMGAVAGNRLGIASGMISALKNLGSMSGVAVTSLVSTVTQLTVLGRLRALGLPPALAERQSFASAVRVTFLLSAGICFVVVLTSLVRGRDEVLDDRENLAAVGSSR